MKWTLAVLFLFSKPSLADDVKNLLCRISPHSIKEMGQYNTVDYQESIFSQIALAENQESVSLEDIRRRVADAFSAKEKLPISSYTPYALLNLIIQAAVKQDSPSFVRMVDYSKDLCDLYNERQNYVCSNKKLRQNLGPITRLRYCGKDLTSMEDVCPQIETIASNADRYYQDLPFHLHQLEIRGYFVEKQKILDGKRLRSTDSLALTGGLVMMMGLSTGKMLAAEVDQANGQISRNSSQRAVRIFEEACENNELKKHMPFKANFAL